jgi:hypothetical protein
MVRILPIHRLRTRRIRPKHTESKENPNRKRLAYKQKNQGDIIDQALELEMKA